MSVPLGVPGFLTGRGVGAAGLALRAAAASPLGTCNNAPALAAPANPPAEPVIQFQHMGTMRNTAQQPP